jgi:hypothetical protein
MERADLLYSGIMFAAVLLSLWTPVLLALTIISFAPPLRKSAPAAATISSTRRPVPLVWALINHGSKKAAPPRSVSQTLS